MKHPSPTAGPTQATGAVRPVYDAFISYSQRGDKAVARALRTVIQTIGKPWWKVRSLNVFLDATSLSAAPSLWQGIADKLDRSRYLILLASPEAAASKWVDREVAHFIAENGIDRLLIALTDGELAWDEDIHDFRSDAALPLPPSLHGRFAEEPLWVDLRAFRDDPALATKSNQGFLHASLDLAATIHGVEKADLYSEEVRQQRRSVRLAYGVAVVVAGLGIGAGIAAWIATTEAERATRNFAIAKGTVDDVVFDIAQGLREVEGMRLESLRTILDHVEEAVSRLSEAAADDTDIMRSRGAMLGEFGDTYRAAGDRSSALAAYRES
ncbi:MAG: toll/interleukin-1 receptor domain-containing protein, partial [Bauldia litoralis]